MNLSATIDVLGGLALLFLGAEVLVRGASRLAWILGIPPVVVGLTVVAFGTSAPELAVSALSAVRGVSGIAVGNVIGSNIFNVLPILGLVALVRPLEIHSRVVWRDVPIMVAVSLITLAFAWNGRISKLEGILLTGGLALFLWTMRGASSERSDGAAARETRPPKAGIRGVAFELATVAFGLFLLVWGARWLVRGATALAVAFGWSDLLIGLTLVAAGTSLPELATSLVAALRKHEDIAVGNVVGSNVFNLLGVMGISAVVAPSPLVVTPTSLRVDFPMMIGAGLLSWLFFQSGRRLSRSEGAFLLASYGLYTAYLFVDAAGRTVPPAIWMATAASVIVTLTCVFWMNRRSGPGRAPGSEWVT